MTDVAEAIGATRRALRRFLDMSSGIVGHGSHTILVCHSNRNLVRVAKLQAERYGIRVIVVADPKNVVKTALIDAKPDAIVLSDDLKNPSSDELKRLIQADPRLSGVQVLILKGVLEGIGQLLKGFRPPPWQFPIAGR